MRKLTVVAIIAAALAVNASARSEYSVLEMAITMVEPCADALVDDSDWGTGLAEFDSVDWGADLAEVSNLESGVHYLLNRLFGG